MKRVKTIETLLIEDNPAESRIITEILSEEAQWININIVKDGEEAMGYLHKKGKYKNRKTPSLIILDLNLPKKKGMEVLEEIKNDDILKCIPVVVLTISSDENDISESYLHHASAYITKPVDLDKFRKNIYTFKNYWFNNAVLPERTYKP